MTANNVTVNSAHISWNGEADSYNVRYATATVSGTTLDPVFEDGFENGLGNWTTYARAYDNADYNWIQYDGNLVDEGNHTGNYVAASRSWHNSNGDQSVDNWLVTPQMTLGNTLKFWVATNEGYPDSYAVYVSTGSGIVPSSGTGDFVVVANLTLATGTWTEKTYDLSAYAGQQGYVAIRHKDNAKDHLLVDDFGVYNTINAYTYGTFTTLPPTSETSCNITGLSPETLYVAQVQADCGDPDGASSWVSVYFTTPDACSAPTDMVTSNITATTATLGWADNQESYNVRYRKVYFYEDFEGETLPTGWTTIDANNDGNCWQIGSAQTHSGADGVCNLSFVYSSDFSINTTPDDYLISPLLDLQGTLRVWLSGYTRNGSNFSEHFAIYVSTSGNTVSDFTTTLVGETTTTNSYVEYTADLSSYAGQQGYIAIRHFNCTNQNYLYVDDFGLYGSENWVSVTPNPTDATTTLTGLTPTIENGNHYLPTTYEWQVQGIDCDGNGGTTDWSAPATFTTGEGYVLHIDGYSASSNGWYLIASPIGDVPIGNVTNLNANQFDLYYFDQTQQPYEWINYYQGSDPNFNSLQKGKGYLYANSGDVDLVFNGTAYNQNGDVTLVYSEENSDSNMWGWNLIGNPFAEEATIVDWEYMRMNDEHNEIILYDGLHSPAVAPMEGIFVHATKTGSKTVTFTKSSKGNTTTNGDRIMINISQDQKVIDRAAVRFGEGQQLPKYQLNQNSTKVYIPVDGEDFAVVRSEGVGELPVNFKAQENGNYTLSLNTEMNFGYLHLVDNMTGNDIDMLANPSYSFEARTTDYSQRFKLVFATGDNANDNFAYFSNGSFVINNEGNATLQVIDVTGRILKSESINGCTNVNVNAASGIYMIRLINGDNVKVQKVFVK